jgi:hypothetical protein
MALTKGLHHTEMFVINSVGWSAILKDLSATRTSCNVLLFLDSKASAWLLYELDTEPRRLTSVCVCIYSQVQKYNLEIIVRTKF